MGMNEWGSFILTYFFMYFISGDVFPRAAVRERPAAL